MRIYNWFEIETLFGRDSCQNKRAHTQTANEVERRRTETNGIVCASKDRKKDAASGSISKKDFHIFCRCIDSRALGIRMHVQQTNRLA